MHRPARRGPRRITFLTNPDECNLACPMCRDRSPLRAGTGPAAGPPRRLAPELVERALDECGPDLREVVASTRGEPLLWPGLEGLARSCAARGLALNVTTNGTFPGRGAAAWADLLIPVCSDVKVSWNAATPATAAALMPGLDWEAALGGVRALLRVRDRRRAAGDRASTVTFQVTAQERNVAELPQVVGLAAELGVDRVKVNQLQVHFAALAGEDLRRSAASRARWNAAVAGMRTAAAAGPAPWIPPRLQHVEGWDEPRSVPYAPCPFLGEEAWVAVDGEFLPCPAPAGQEGALGRFGSLHQRSLGSIWESAAYRALVEEHAARTPCARCALRRPGGL